MIGSNAAICVGYFKYSSKRSLRTVRGSEKTNFNMAEGNTDYQVNACKKFFPKEFEPLKDEVAGQLKGSGYDITKFDAYEVVELLSQIVNDRGQFKEGNAFRFFIRNGEETEELFQLAAKPTPDQPGNGILSLLKWKKKKIHAAKSYTQLCIALKDHYEKNTKSFASHIKKLFRNNEVVNEEDFPQVTFEAYMLWVFEIARRLVSSVESPPDRKKQLDNLPIGSAIARLVKLMELGSEEICTFDDVFLPKGTFHCFADPKPLERKKAIDRMNETLHLLELSKMFYWEERRVDTPTEEFKSLAIFEDTASDKLTTGS